MDLDLLVHGDCGRTVRNCCCTGGTRAIGQVASGSFDILGSLTGVAALILVFFSLKHIKSQRGFNAC